jgi:ribosomal protein S18 acetylase RimI-like enzyme
MENTDIHPLDFSYVAEAADVISQAFMEDPLCVFMLPSKRNRLKTLRKFFHLYGEINIKNHRGYGVGEPLQGVAFWIEPTRPDVSISVRSLGLFLPLLFSMYPLGYLRARAILKKIDLQHQKYAAEPHYYLDNIGVLPSARGKGYSSRLIRPFLEKADLDKAITYTDTVTRANVGLYEHFGFQCMEECPVDRTGITVWSLLRPVQSS